jgi:hypothetical protein
MQVVSQVSQQSMAQHARLHAQLLLLQAELVHYFCTFLHIGCTFKRDLHNMLHPTWQLLRAFRLSIAMYFTFLVPPSVM